MAEVPHVPIVTDDEAHTAALRLFQAAAQATPSGTSSLEDDLTTITRYVNQQHAAAFAVREAVIEDCAQIAEEPIKWNPSLDNPMEILSREVSRLIGKAIRRRKVSTPVAAELAPIEDAADIGRIRSFTGI